MLSKVRLGRRIALKLVLLRDIVIPAGTVFHEASTTTHRTGPHVEHTIGLTSNTSGSLVYGIDDDDIDGELGKWFATVED